MEAYTEDMELCGSLYWTLPLTSIIFAVANKRLPRPEVCFCLLFTKGFLLMPFASKFLPVLALAVALSPLAAYAQTAPQRPQPNGQTVVQSGPVNQIYPASTVG
jgi:hypothetical protein